MYVWLLYSTLLMFPMLIALLCIAVPAFDCEFSSGSYAQVATSKRGRTQTAFAKLFAVTLAVFVLSALLVTVTVAFPAAVPFA